MRKMPKRETPIRPYCTVLRNFPRTEYSVIIYFCWLLIIVSIVVRCLQDIPPIETML